MQELDGALTVDLEDWRSALNPRADADYRRRPPVDGDYLTTSARKLMADLDGAGAKATFFVLGEVAAAVPDLVREIASKGHEVASHSPVHLPIRSIPRPEFKAMMLRDWDLLSGLASGGVLGFRAPYFSVRRSDGWLVETLADIGFRYDSSVVPTWTPYWGLPSAPKAPYLLDPKDLARKRPAGRLLEIPVSVWPTWRLLGLPIGGGFYMRAWPTSMLVRMLRRNIGSGHPLVLYIHPGNLEADKPKISSPTLRDRLSQYAAAGRGETSFRRLLKEFRFGTVREVFSSEIARVGRS